MNYELFSASFRYALKHGTLSRYIATPQSGSSRGVATCFNPGRLAEGVQQVQ